jgi:hypothetical protein
LHATLHGRGDVGGRGFKSHPVHYIIIHSIACFVEQ